MDNGEAIDYHKGVLSRRLITTNIGTIPKNNWFRIGVGFETIKHNPNGDIKFVPYIYRGNFVENKYWVRDFKLEKGNNITPWQPAPEDLKYAKSYPIGENIQSGKSYTLSADITNAEWIGVWLGRNHFAGYFNGDSITFEGLDGVEEVIIKSSSPKTTIENLKLND